ncbi:hypothetical protein AgCh_023404 [Apium graveolens]
MYANLVIDDEKEGGIIVPSNEVVAQKQTYMLVGKFLTEKHINYHAMQNVMAGIWRPKEGMEIYDIPTGFLSENILKSVGSSIGQYIKSDPDTFKGGWKPYVRIRVLLDVEKPLKRRMKIKREGDIWSWLNFKYEKLGTFCFVCGIIGHGERECNVVYANPEKVIEKAYGVWLRAPNKNVRNNTGARWLRSNKDGGGMWEQNAGTTMHGGTQVGERFMEVEGVIRQTTDDTKEIRVKSRENREVVVRDGDPKIMGLEKGEVSATENGMDTENIVMDAKRKRLNTDVVGENQGKEMVEYMETQPTDGSKNLLVAGPGVQARQGL